MNLPIKWILSKKTALAAAVTALSLLLITGVLLALLPLLVSSATVKNMIEEKTSSALGTEIAIGRLFWSWSDGLLLNNIRIKNHPDFSGTDLFTLDRAHLRLSFRALLKRRVQAEIRVSGIGLNIIKDETGRLNIDRLSSEKPEVPAIPEKPAATEPTEKTAPPAAESVTGKFSLPVDLALDMTLDDLNICYTDPASQQTIALENLFSRIEIPSLMEKPINFELATDMNVNGALFPGQRLELTVSHPGFENRQMDLTEIIVFLDGRLPGITLSGYGRPLKEGFTGDMVLDIPALKSLTDPFLRPDLKDLTVSGTLGLSYDIKSDPFFKVISLNSTLHINNTIASGGPLPNGPLGPLSLALTNQGYYYPNDNRLFIKTGRMTITDHNHLSYSLDILDLDGDDPWIDFNLGPLQIDLKKLYDFIGPVLPDDLRRNPPVLFDSLALTIAEIGFSGRINDRPELTMENLMIAGPAIRVNDPAAPLELAVTEPAFFIPRAFLTLKDLFPETAFVSMGLNLSSLTLSGDPEIRAEALSLSDLDITATGLKPCPESPLGVTGEVHVRNRLAIDSVTVQDTVALTGLSQFLDLSGRLSGNPPAGLTLTRFDTVIDDIQVNLPETDTMATGLDLSVSVPEIIVTSLAPFSMDIAGATVQMAMNDTLTLSARAGATDSAGAGYFHTDGRLFLDLARLSKTAPPSLLNGIILNGTTALDWNFSGRRFTDAELTGLTTAPHRLKENLSFIDQAAVSLSIADMAVEMALPENQTMRVRSISTGEPLAYSYDGQSGAGRLAGKLKIQEILSFPGNPFNRPPAMEFDIRGNHEGLETISLTQSLRLAPLNLRKTLALELTGADRLLSTAGAIDPVADILRHLGGVLTLSLGPDGEWDFSAINDLPSLSGKISAGVNLRLVPGETATINLSADASDINAAEPDHFILENADAAVRFDKTWNILTTTADPELFIRPLSVQVLETETETSSPNTAAAEEMARFLEGMKTRLHPARTLSLTRFEMETTPLPLAVTDMELNLVFNEGTPDIPYLRLDLFGGTIITAAAFSRRAGNWFFDLDLAFSGIDTGKALPERAGRPENPDTEISGKMAVSLPLTSHTTDLMGGLNMDVHFSHIGKRALERILYALDPTESNEQIVSRRKLLRRGTPRWIRLQIEDGTLSLSGKMMILNREEDIPPIRRLNIANLSIIRGYEKELEGISPVIEILNRLSASHIDVSDPENIRFIQQF